MYSISIKIPTYNCAKYLKETIESILGQQQIDLNLLEIEVVDDCSTLDNPEEIVAKFGKGRVTFFKQSQNVGAVRNFNTCIERCSADYLHILHGDDTVEPNFYQTFLSDIGNNEAFFTQVNIIDENGIFKELSQPLTGLSRVNDLYYGNAIRTPGVVVKRSVYDRIGRFDEELVHVADWEMWIRILANCTTYTNTTPIANYRDFPLNDTAKLTRTAENIRDFLRLHDKIKLNRDFHSRTFLKMCRKIAYAQAQLYKLKDYDAFKKNNEMFIEITTKLYGTMVARIFPTFNLGII
jgi:glycosyltransferase involved in cell wall biosynthesis